MSGRRRADRPVERVVDLDFRAAIREKIADERTLIRPAAYRGSFC